MKWTDDQQKAIDGRKGTLLVSAAAGSGKTAVLVERVIRRICDSENPCGVENLLIVTFTKAAAAQMKEKIEAAISKKIAENPSDKRLRRQQLMLPCANICTIDSFCINLVCRRRIGFSSRGGGYPISDREAARVRPLRCDIRT